MVLFSKKNKYFTYGLNSLSLFFRSDTLRFQAAPAGMACDTTTCLQASKQVVVHDCDIRADGARTSKSGKTFIIIDG